MIPTLGIDIGRVIIAAANSSGGDTSFLSAEHEQALLTPASPGAFKAIRELNDVFDGRVWLVSKAGQKIQARSRAWLTRSRFWDLTGVPSDHIRFCRERHEKAAHCVRLGVTHFVDDRSDVLRTMEGIVPCLYLFGPQPSRARLLGMTPVINWSAARAAILRDRPSGWETPETEMGQHP